jgi:hypothetical protein
MPDELLEKLKKAILQSGYPLELQAGAILEKYGWTCFHSVEYVNPETNTLRELDIFAYKIIRGRRIELRISCKTSINKQWVFFTKDTSRHLDTFILKFTPVSDDHNSQWQIPLALKNLRFFSENKESVNYTVFTGTNVDREGRSLLRDAILSSLNSIYVYLIPDRLLFDARGTLHFFLVLYRGKMYEANLNEDKTEMNIQDCNYIQWSGRFNISDKFSDIKIPNQQGKPVNFADALYWFRDRFRVEIISDTYFESYLRQTEEVFKQLSEEELNLFGKEWNEENFPQNLSPYPKLEPKEE